MRIVPALLVTAALAAIGSAAGADGPTYYRVILNSKAVYGTTVDETHFRTCAGVVIEVPAGVRPTPVNGSCPTGEGPFAPFSGHLKPHATAKPTPRRTPQAKPAMN